MFDLTNKNNDLFDCFTGLFNDAFAKELKTNIKEDEKSYYLEVETPGVAKENINISFNDDTLIIKIKKNEEKENKEETYLRKERVSMDMERSFYLENSNEDSIEVGADGLARQKAKGVSFAEAEQTPDLTLYSGSAPRAIPDVDPDVFDDLELLSQIMYRLQSIAGRDPLWITDDLREIQKLQQQIQNADLRALAQTQIDNRNGDELSDSYVTGILFEGKLYLQDLYVAGVHIASLQTQ